jgi:hypothetical protein
MVLLSSRFIYRIKYLFHITQRYLFYPLFYTFDLTANVEYARLKYPFVSFESNRVSEMRGGMVMNGPYQQREP